MAYWDDKIKSFSGHIECTDGLARNTLIAYMGDCQSFIDFLKNDYPKIYEGRKISVNDARLFLIDLKKKGLKQVSIARKLDSLKRFGDYLVDLGDWKPNPFRELPYPKAEHYRAEYLTPEEAFGMLSIKFKNDYSGSRDHVMLELFYACGLRLSELVNINM